MLVELLHHVVSGGRKISCVDTEVPGALPVSIEEQSLEAGDALKAEIESFLACIRDGTPPVVGGEDGLRALETALRITEQVRASAAART